MSSSYFAKHIQQTLTLISFSGVFAGAGLLLLRLEVRSVCADDVDADGSRALFDDTCFVPFFFLDSSALLTAFFAFISHALLPF